MLATIILLDLRPKNARTTQRILAAEQARRSRSPASVRKAVSDFYRDQLVNKR